jgi:hypothetical protein
MEVERSFQPPRKRGLIIHGIAAFLAAAGSGICFWLAPNQEQTLFGILILLGIVFAIGFPFILYFLYALLTAKYQVNRDGLYLKWGLRTEAIPLHLVEWVRPAYDFGLKIPEPKLKWPGAVLGKIRSEDLGPIEYMASVTENCLLIATASQIFIISPEEDQKFLSEFRLMTEMGSLAAVDYTSTIPVAYLQSVWQDKIARWMILGGIASTTLLFIFINIMISTHSLISLGFDPYGAPLPPVSASNLILLPIINTIFLLIDISGGLYLYRSKNNLVLAYFLWACAPLLSIILLIGSLFII